MRRGSISSRRAGFTLPEVLVALLIVSGLMIGALDAMRAFDGARIRALGAAHNVEARRVLDQKLDRIAASSAADQIPDATAMRDRLQGALESDSPSASIFALRAIPSASGGTAAWVVEADGQPVLVTPTRIDAPTPCVFDVVARRCRT